MAKPKIFFYHDGRHPLIYMYEPPMQKEEYEAGVNELVGTPVEAIAFCTGDGRTVLHETKAGELWGSPVDKWSHIIFRRAHQNAKHLIEEGNDPLRVIGERAHAKGLQLYPTLLVQQGTGKRGVDNRSSNFRFENRHLEIGVKGDLDAAFPGIEFLDFKHQEVRDERFALIEETIDRYDIDGFELQMNYGPYYFHPNEVEAGRGIMTDWIRRVHEAVKASGADRELMVRAPADLELCLERGMDVREWIREGLVDVIVGEGSRQYQIDVNADFRPLVEETRGTECRVLAPLLSHMDTDRLNEASIATIRAEACNYWRQGVDGFYLAQWFSRWPYKASFYEILREIPYPDVMDAKDKTYHIYTKTGRYPIEQQGTGLVPHLPADLVEGETTSVEMTISDDLERWDRVGRVHEVLLRIRIVGATELDELSFRINDSEIPTSLMRTINQMYTMSSPRFRVGGYWFVFRLDREHWPTQGANRIDVTLRKRDADVTPGIFLRDVELDIKYLMGKNFHRGFVDDDLGPYEFENE
jgi:hypothetical protein